MKKLIMGWGVFAFLFVGMAQASFDYTNNSGYRQRIIYSETNDDGDYGVSSSSFFQTLYPGERVVRDDSTTDYGYFVRSTTVSLNSIDTLVGRSISFQASNGQYVCAEGGGGREVVANRGGIGPWETFVFQTGNGGTISSGDQGFLRTDHGFFLCAENGGGSTLNGTRFYGGSWEQFKIWKLDGNGTITGGIINSGDTVAITSTNFLFLVAEGGGGREVNANRYAIGPWEKFTITVH